MDFGTMSSLFYSWKYLGSGKLHLNKYKAMVTFKQFIQQLHEIGGTPITTILKTR